MVRRPVFVTGSDPLTKPILDYLERKYGIPPQDVRGIRLDSEINQALTVDVTLIVDKDGFDDTDQ